MFWEKVQLELIIWGVTVIIDGYEKPCILMLRLATM